MSYIFGLPELKADDDQEEVYCIYYLWIGIDMNEIPTTTTSHLSARNFHAGCWRHVRWNFVDSPSSFGDAIYFRFGLMSAMLK